MLHIRFGLTVLGWYGIMPYRNDADGLVSCYLVVSRKDRCMMFTRKKKGTMLAKRSGTDGPRQVVKRDGTDVSRHLAERSGTGNQRQIVKGTDEVSPRTLAKRDEAADPSKVARLVLERIENFPETYHQRHWLGLRQKDGSVNQALVKNWIKINNLPVLSASAWSDCGSTGCVAGHTSAVAAELGMILPTSPANMLDMAGKALKLTMKQGNWLFYGNRSLGEVKTALNLIISGQSHKIPKSDWSSV